MGGSALGLILGLGVDPSDARQGLEEFDSTVNQSTESLRKSFKSYNYDALGGTKDLDKALLSQRESVRLMAEEFGIHLPRAVSSGLSQMLPPINMIGPALLGAFALAEIPKFLQEIHDATDAMEGFGKEAKKAFEDAITASDNSITHFKTIKEGISLEGEVNRNIAALSVQQDVLESTGGVAINYANAVFEFLSGNAAAGVAYMSMAKAQKLDMAELGKLEGQRLEQLNTRTELEVKGHESAAKAARKAAEEKRKDNEFIQEALEKWAEEDEAADRRGWQNLAHLDAERFNIAEKAGKEIAAENAGLERQAQAQARINIFSIDYLATLDLIAGVQFRQAAMAKDAGIFQLASEINATKHLGLARKELIGVTQDLHKVEDAFSDAMKGDLSALESMTQTVGGIGEQFAQAIGGTKAAAAVKGAYDAALSIEYFAQFIGSMGTDMDALLASVQYGLAAEQMFKVAGSGGGGSRGGGGGGGGGTQSSYGRSGGRGGSSSSGSAGGGAATPGSGTTVHLHLEGPGWTQEHVVQLMAQMTGLAKSGQGFLIANGATTNQGRMT